MGQLWVDNSGWCSNEQNLIFSVKAHLFCLQMDCCMQRSGTKDFLKKILQYSQAVLFSDFQISMAYSKLPAREQIMDEGYDPAFGARPLKRTIRRQKLEGISPHRQRYNNLDYTYIDFLAD
jgi:ATPases with chaperone activity, ATP-binding subunit